VQYRIEWAVSAVGAVQDKMGSKCSWCSTG